MGHVFPRTHSVVDSRKFCSCLPHPGLFRYLYLVTSIGNKENYRLPFFLFLNDTIYNILVEIAGTDGSLYFPVDV